MEATIMKLKCQACNRPIKYEYTWDGQTLGIECWKKIALPEIEKQRAAQREIWKRERWEEEYALVEAIKQKDFSKIRSEFKLKFLNSLVEQFEEKGYLSGRQKQIVYGTGGWNGRFYDYGMLNAKDKLHEAIALYLIGGETNKQRSLDIAETFTEKDRETFNKEIA